MKLKTTTIILVFLALGLGSFVYFLEIKGKQAQEKVESTKKQIFNFVAQDIQTLVIETEGKKLKFERTNQATQPWKMTEPEDTPASEAAISFLVDLLIELEINQSFAITQEQLADYGLVQPLAKILIQLNNQQEHRVILGGSNFDNTSIYAQVDPATEPQDSIDIVLLSKNFQYAVERDFDEWKEQPPDTEANEQTSSDDK